MANASDYLENQVGTHLLRTGSWTKPSALYVALFTVMPSEAGTGGTEANYGGYERQLYGPSDATWSAPVDEEFSNLSTVQFPVPTSGTNDIVGFGLYDASSAGNYLIGNAFASTLTVYAGSPAPAFAVGQLKVTVS